MNVSYQYGKMKSYFQHQFEFKVDKGVKKRVEV